MKEVVNFVQVSEVMTRRPVVISPEKTVVDAAVLMRRHAIGSLLVMEDKDVKGIITLDDIVYRLVAENKDVSKVKVIEAMSTGVISIKPTSDVNDAMELMNENNIKQLPVLTEGELVGFLTLKDILRIEPALLDLTLEQIRSEENERQTFVQKMFEKQGLDIDEDLFD